jgi:hypothetical protein
VENSATKFSQMQTDSFFGSIFAQKQMKKFFTHKFANRDCLEEFFLCLARPRLMSKLSASDEKNQLSGEKKMSGIWLLLLR